VVGLPKGRAAQALRAAGLRPQLAFLTFGDHVIEQSVQAGTRARRGSTVQLVLNAFHV
jgi:beta-lactam-binding protein with PASTA domain